MFNLPPGQIIHVPGTKSVVTFYSIIRAVISGTVIMAIIILVSIMFTSLIIIQSAGVLVSIPLWSMNLYNDNLSIYFS